MAFKKKARRSRSGRTQFGFPRSKKSKNKRPPTSVTKSVQSPAIASGFARVTMIPLGGADSIGRSCYLYIFHRPYGCGKPFVVMVDTGLQPGAKMFPDTYERDMLPAFDLIPQGLSVDAIVITHGHLDHIGASTFFLKALRSPATAGRAERPAPQCWNVCSLFVQERSDWIQTAVL